MVERESSVQMEKFQEEEDRYDVVTMTDDSSDLSLTNLASQLLGQSSILQSTIFP